MLTAKKTPLLKFGMAALALAVVAVLTVGCSQNAPNAPVISGTDALKALAEIDAQFGEDAFSDRDADDLAKRGRAVVLTVVDGNQAVIGAAGGIMNLRLGKDRATFTVPPCALNEDVLITAIGGTFKTPYGKVFRFNFYPCGLKFMQPATLSLDADFVSGRPVTLYWFNERTGRWQVEAVGTPDRDGKVSFKIYHFSKYAIS